jgi:hypothetical protein
MLPQLRGTPVVALSGETGKGVERLMPAVLKSHKDWSTKVKTRDLNDWLQMAMQRHPPPSVGGKRIKPKYMAQTKARPPTFVLFSSRADQMPEQYRRYLINSLRESFDLPGVPLRITLKSGANPYAEGEAKGHSGKGKREFERKEREKERIRASRNTVKKSVRVAEAAAAAAAQAAGLPACPRPAPSAGKPASKASKAPKPTEIAAAPAAEPGKAAVKSVKKQGPQRPEEVDHAQLQGRLQGGGRQGGGLQDRAASSRGRRPHRPRQQGAAQGALTRPGTAAWAGLFPMAWTRDKPTCSTIRAPGPPGFVYRPEVIDPDEEAVLAEALVRARPAGLRDAGLCRPPPRGLVRPALRRGRAGAGGRPADPGLPASVARQGGRVRRPGAGRVGPRVGQRIPAGRADRLASRQAGVRPGGRVLAAVAVRHALSAAARGRLGAAVPGVGATLGLWLAGEARRSGSTASRRSRRCATRSPFAPWPRTLPIPAQRRRWIPDASAEWRARREGFSRASVGRRAPGTAGGLAGLEARHQLGQGAGFGAQLEAAAVACSTMAAFCWVTWSIWLTAELTWLRPVACSCEDWAISEIRVSISATLPTMPLSAWPVSPTSWTPRATCEVLLAIRVLISLAASAERWARARTSWATTAKPRPASPARAASTPAFRARRLVWKAISSITPMIWVIWPELCSISPMAATASRTTSPERAASAGRWRRRRGLLGAGGAAADRGGDLVQSGGGLLQAGGLLLGAARQVVGGGGDLVGAGAQPLGGVNDLAHRRAQAVDRGVEVFLDRQEAAFEGLGDPGGQVAGGQTLQIGGQRADDGALLGLGLATLLVLDPLQLDLRDVDGELDDLAGLAGGVEDRVVVALDPDVLAALAHALELVGEELAAPQAGPEGLVLGAAPIGRVRRTSRGGGRRSRPANSRRCRGNSCWP